MTYNPAGYIENAKRYIDVKKRQLANVKEELFNIEGTSNNDIYWHMVKADDIHDISAKIISKMSIVHTMERNSEDPIRTLDVLHTAYGDTNTQHEDIADAVAFVIPHLRDAA